jgi:hypothetical protein
VAANFGTMLRPLAPKREARGWEWGWRRIYGLRLRGWLILPVHESERGAACGQADMKAGAIDMEGSYLVPGREKIDIDLSVSST